MSSTKKKLKLVGKPKKNSLEEFMSIEEFNARIKNMKKVINPDKLPFPLITYYEFMEDHSGFKCADGFEDEKAAVAFATEYAEKSSKKIILIDTECEELGYEVWIEK
ncbi:MAG: hypothetical protein HY200_09475 [Nitrospirae bacterium]|nr:hypothetical protein [Nitrospirota bacterium]MBI3595173.1 hypothetical protein [Nitrospirota bacterium]